MLKNLKKFFLSSFATLWDERRCALCHAPFSPNHSQSADVAQFEYTKNALPQSDLLFCDQCKKLLQRQSGNRCPQCGLLFAWQEATLCGECLTSPPPWRNFRFYADYDLGVRQMLLCGKFGADIPALHVMGKMLAQRCADLPKPDGIVPIPLHFSRLRQRGFNQSLEIARPIAKKIHAPLRPEWLVRTQATKHQVGQSREERLASLQGAFASKAAVQGKTVLLVDDIFTTGTTLRRATETLLKSGAFAVDIAVVGRTQKNRIRENA